MKPPHSTCSGNCEKMEPLSAKQTDLTVLQSEAKPVRRLETHQLDKNKLLLKDDARVSGSIQDGSLLKAGEPIANLRAYCLVLFIAIALMSPNVWANDLLMYLM